jgi:hypothetical protein
MGSFGGALFGGNPFAWNPGTFPASGATTPAGIFSLVRSLLVGNPDDTSIFSDTDLQSYFNLAYPELYQAMGLIQSPRVRREFYYLVPAYTSYVDPLQIGVVDVDEPEMVEERISGGSIPIATTGTDTPIIVTTQVPHNLATNADIAVGEVLGSDAPNGRWFITVIDDLNFSLNGSASDGNSGTGGAVYIFSGARFVRIASLSQVTDRPLSSRLLDYLWEDSVFKLRGATIPVQIRVTYWANGNPPQNPATPLNIEGCTPYLSYRIAGLAAGSKSWWQLSDKYEIRALGKNREADASGGLLRSFLAIQVQNAQNNPVRKQPFGQNVQTDFPGDFIYGSFSAGGDSPTVCPPPIREAYYHVPVFNGTAFLDLAQGNVQAVSPITGPTFIRNPDGVGVIWNLVLEQDSVGGHLVTFDTRFTGIDPTGFSGAGVDGTTRVVIQFANRPDNTIIFGGIIYGPAPY